MLSYKQSHNDVKDLLLQLSPADRVHLCQTLNVAISHTYPLICTRLTSQTNFLDICNNNNINLVVDFVNEDKILTIPKQILLVFDNKEIYFGEEFTKIPEYLLKRYHLACTETLNSYVITKHEDFVAQGSNITLGEEIIVCPSFIEDDSTLETDEIPCEDSFESNEDYNILHRQEISTEGANSSVLETAACEISCEDSLSSPEESNRQEIPTNGDNSFFFDTADAEIPCEDFYESPEENNILHRQEIQNDGDTYSSGNLVFNSTAIDEENISQHTEGINMNEEINTGPNYADEFEVYPRQKFRYINMFRHPENLGNTDINMIHIERIQFFEFVRALKPQLEQIQIKSGKKPLRNVKRKRHLFTKAKNQQLSIFSLAFLFRLKLAKNKSFGELSTLFVISRSHTRKIYKKILDIVYKHHVALPDILKGTTEVEKIFEELALSMDPFYREMFRPFKDPKGIIHNFSVFNKFYISSKNI